MKSIKMFGLAALAALMAMAFVGASSAMAENTTLCASDSIPCEAISHVHETSVGKAKLLSSITVECDVLFLGDTLVGTINPLKIHGTFTYTNCGSCVVTEESSPAEIKVLKEGHETSKVTGEGLVHVECSGFIDCSYNGVGLVGTGKGPLLSTQANGEVTITGATTNKEAGGFLCPATSKLDITTTPLSATYLATGADYCVKYEHTGKSRGLYLDSTCTARDTKRAGDYALVVAKAGLAVNTVVCVHLYEKVGLYTNSICTSDDAGTPNASLWEEGKVQ